MSVFRAAMSFPRDSALPRDAMVVGPHFDGDDAQSLLTVLLQNLKDWNPTSLAPCTVKIYDAQKAPPSFPIATGSNPGATPNGGNPRETALCLSYYTTYNRPRYRGRLYLPADWFGTGVGLKPTSGIMTAALGFATSVLRRNLPTATVWCVYSTTEKKSQGAVTDAWVDNEWDTVRSRGLKADARQTAHF